MACPFMASAAAPAPSADDAAKCPFMSGKAVAAVDDAPAAAAPAAVCPLGFGSSRGPRLSSLHCPVCRGLLHEAASVTQCKHTFCQACISKTRDCPVCGMDIQATEPNAELSGLVDTFLETHSKSPELVAAQADLGQLPDNSPASFFMAQGLKSLAGGNVHAALHRLSRCHDALLAAAAAAGADEAGGDSVTEAALQPGSSDSGEAATARTAPEDATGATHQQHQHQQQAGEQAASHGVAAACQLAACCGCLGDCYLRLDEPAQAHTLYVEAIESVARYSEADAEAAHAMSVSLNKLGDLQYMQQELPAAKQQYRRALQLRQLCCGPLSGGQAGPAQQLELASCLIKLADVCKALGDAEEGDQLLRRAQGVCFEVKLQEADLPASVTRKLELLMDVLHAQSGSAEAT